MTGYSGSHKRPGRKAEPTEPMRAPEEGLKRSVALHSSYLPSKVPARDAARYASRRDVIVARPQPIHASSIVQP